MTVLTESKESESVSRKQGESFRFPLGMTLIALLLGLVFEILFYGHSIGISFPIMAFLCMVALLGVARLERRTCARETILFGVPILFFSIMVLLRREPLTVFLNVVFTLCLFALWVRSFRMGRVLEYGWLDIGLTFIAVPLDAWIRPWSVLGSAQKAVFKEGERRGVLLAILRGIVLAIPILVIFLALLTTADLVFADRVEAALKWLDMERLAEYAGRGILVILSGLFFLGALVSALRDVGERKLIGEEKAILKPFLGIIETVVVLGAVNLLFASFVLIQFAYLFGGEANINLAGYTYSEYARRGFSELVVVGILSLALILSFAWWTKREGRKVQSWFNALGCLLIVQVGIILASALKRLLLYEQAYGFTRLRTYTHVFIPWMGILLLVFLALLLVGKVRYFAVAVSLGAMGFLVTLNLLNIDAFIVKRNIARLDESGEVDIGYLAGLSEDAVPSLAYFADGASGEIREALMPELACWQVQLVDQLEEHQWPSFHLSLSTANRILSDLVEEFRPYTVHQEYWGQWQVEYQGESAVCHHQWWLAGMD
jgi:hypothetical protein